MLILAVKYIIHVFYYSPNIRLPGRLSNIFPTHPSIALGNTTDHIKADRCQNGGCHQWSSRMIAQFCHRLRSDRCRAITMATTGATRASCQDKTTSSMVPFARFKICTACSWVAPSSVSLLTDMIWSPRFSTPFSAAAPLAKTVLT